MALIAMVVFEPYDASRVAWRMAVPGVASTLLIVVSALQMGAQVGTGSLSAREVPVGILAMVGVAGMLRLLAYPLHPRGLHTPENAAALLLSVGAGIYLVARVQTIGPGLGGLEWMLTIGTVALLAGGLLAWTGGDRLAEKPGPSAPPPRGVLGAEGPGSQPLGGGGATGRELATACTRQGLVWHRCPPGRLCPCFRSSRREFGTLASPQPHAGPGHNDHLVGWYAQENGQSPASAVPIGALSYAGPLWICLSSSPGPGLTCRCTAHRWR
jgi:hypothetical protein